jgi:prepilin-type N-terminal cleavage/methylation domain-containing protein
MSRAYFRQRLWLHFLSKQAKPSGFTLLELLVAMIVGALISAGLLLLVVQLIQTNSREAARSDTQRDLQAAIDYIARDVREAVYVYDGNCLSDRPSGSTLECPGLRNYLPTDISETPTNLPVLAFWRVDPLTQELDDRCVNNANSFSLARTDPGRFPAAIEGVPCLSGRMYTLVVYSLNWGSAAGAKGRARIRRYELPQFTTEGSKETPPKLNQGWVDPSRNETDFFVWPLDNSTLAAASPISLQGNNRPQPPSNNLVLTDFVDRFGLYDASNNKAQAPLLNGYELTPSRGSSASDEPNRGFYVYVKGTQNRGTLNQEVVIRIQGDAAGRPGVGNVELNRPVIPLSLETRVLTRGVTGKTD